MLNPVARHDWRLLASRLGYSAGNWATQPDPCLSMFEEWFPTHKTKEATYGVLKMLVEMNRTDASVIVEKALKDVGNVTRFFCESVAIVTCFACHLRLFRAVPNPVVNASGKFKRQQIHCQAAMVIAFQM
jgi:Death domain